MKRRISKAKPMNPRGRKKAVKGPELVDRCDNCGKPLGRTNARTVGSAVCAGGEDIKTHVSNEFIGFFCGGECRGEYVHAKCLKVQTFEN